MNKPRGRPITTVVGPIREVMKKDNRSKTFGYTVESLLEILGNNANDIRTVGNLSRENIKPIRTFLQEYDKITGGNKLNAIMLLQLLKGDANIATINALGVEILNQYKKELTDAINLFDLERKNNKKTKRAEKDHERIRSFKTFVRPIQELMRKSNRGNKTFIDSLLEFLAILGNNKDSIKEIGTLDTRTIKSARDFLRNYSMLDIKSNEELMTLLIAEDKNIDQIHRSGGDILYHYINLLQCEVDKYMKL